MKAKGPGNETSIEIELESNSLGFNSLITCIVHIAAISLGGFLMIWFLMACQRAKGKEQPSDENTVSELVKLNPTNTEENDAETPSNENDDRTESEGSEEDETARNPEALPM